MMNNTDNGSFVDCNRELTKEEQDQYEFFIDENPSLSSQNRKPLFLLIQKYGRDSANSIYGRKCKYGCDWNKAQELFIQGGIVDDPSPCGSSGNETEQANTYLERYLGSDGLLAHKEWVPDALAQMRKQTMALVERIKYVSGQLGGKSLCTALVVGHVQSGKTANFCADINQWMDLASSAREIGVSYNTFIILTANNTALGTQTEARLRKDVICVSDYLENFNNDDKEVEKLVKEYGGLLSFRQDAELRKRPETNKKVAACPTFGMPQNNPRCVIAVAIKNKSAIETLTTYLEHNPNLNQGGVVIIDDEADTITPTRDKEGGAAPTREDILEMVKAIQKEGRPIVYVAFTATPYASVLNQFPSAEGNQMYPHIVQVLETSTEYFGSDRILGGGPREKESGQVQIICEKDITCALDEGKLPDSLKTAFAWFLCTVCARRHIMNQNPQVRKEPISMLIHIDKKRKYHKGICDALKKYVENEHEPLLELCHDLWTGPLKNAYTSTDIPNDYPGRDKIEQYDISWDVIEKYLEELLEADDITLDPSAFSRGVNFRVVNSEDENKNFHFPTDEEKKDKKVPPDVAIVAIGGDRIARGLTLEGLTTSYFARKATSCDSLLQYARWQGYRRHYELLPRVWMTKDNLKNFKDAAWMERETRRKLKREFEDRVDHWKHPVTVAVYRDAKIKATHKMRDAKSGLESYESYSTVDTSYIGTDPSVWEDVFNETVTFVSSLKEEYPSCGDPKKGEPEVWCKIPGGIVLDYLKFVKSKYSSSDSFASWQESFESEITKNNTWRICFIPLNANEGKLGDKTCCSREGYFHGLRMRTVAPNNKSLLYIKTVRANANKDDIVDVPKEEIKRVLGNKSASLTNDDVRQVLEKQHLATIPLLRIYLHAAQDNDGNLYLPDMMQKEDIPSRPIILLSIAAHRLPGFNRDRKIYHVIPAEFDDGPDGDLAGENLDSPPEQGKEDK